MKTQNNDIEYCKKCDRPTSVLISDLDPEEQGHTTRYCGDCGTQYDYILLDLDKVTNTPLYKKIGELHNLYLGERNSSYYNLMSKSAQLAVYRLAKYSLPEILKRDFVNDEKQTQQIEAYAEQLMVVHWNIIMDGYFAWIAEQLLASKKISESKAPAQDVFENEFQQTVSVVYEDFIQND